MAHLSVLFLVCRYMLNIKKELILIACLGYSMYAHSETTVQLNMYQVSPSSGKSAWLLNTETGALSFCTSSSNSSKPNCSPWGKPPTSSPAYRYDPKTKKLIPLNQEARDEQKKRDPLGIR